MPRVRRASLRGAFGFLFVFFAPPLAAQHDAEKIGEARRLLREASGLVLKIPEGQRPTAAANIAGQQARAGDLQGALDTARLLPKTSDQAGAYGSIAWSLGHSGNLAGALRLVAASEDGPDKAIAYVQLSQQRAGVRDFTAALGIAEMISGQPEYKISQLAYIAEKQYAAGDRQGAGRTLRIALREIERLEKEAGGNARSTGWLRERIAAVHFQAGNHGAALEMLEALRTMAQTAKSPDERHELLRALAQGYARLGEFGAAETIVAQMAGSPDQVLLEIARQRAAHGDEAGAVELASRIREPDSARHVFQFIACRQAEAGNLAGAMKTLELLPSDSHRAAAMAGMALSLAGRREPLAGFFLEKAWENARNTREELPSWVWEYIAVSRGLTGDFSGATQILQETKSAEARGWPLWNLTELMVQAGDVQGAAALAENEQEPYPRLYALLGMASGLLEQVEEGRKKRMAAR